MVGGAQVNLLEVIVDKMFQFLARYMEISESERKIILTSSRIVNYKKKEVIKNMTENTSNGYFVLSGCAYSLYNLNEKETVGEFFFEGEPIIVSMNDSDQELFELRSLEDSTLAVINANDSERHSNEFPRFERVCRLFAEERLNKSLHFCNQLKTLSPIEKYHFALKQRPQLIQKVPQHLLAQYLGITPETLSRVRKQMKSYDH